MVIILLRLLDCKSFFCMTVDDGNAEANRKTDKTVKKGGREIRRKRPEKAVKKTSP